MPEAPRTYLPWPALIAIFVMSTLLRRRGDYTLAQQLLNFRLHLYEQRDVVLALGVELRGLQIDEADQGEDHQQQPEHQRLRFQRIEQTCDIAASLSHLRSPRPSTG